MPLSLTEWKGTGMNYLYRGSKIVMHTVLHNPNADRLDYNYIATVTLSGVVMEFKGVEEKQTLQMAMAEIDLMWGKGA